MTAAARCAVRWLVVPILCFVGINRASSFRFISPGRIVISNYIRQESNYERPGVVYRRS